MFSYTFFIKQLHKDKYNNYEKAVFYPNRALIKFTK